MLPLVRKHEYIIYKSIIEGIANIYKIEQELKDNIKNYKYEEFDHALRFMNESGFITVSKSDIKLSNISLDDQFIEYVEDLLSYGLSRYQSQFGESNNFKLWASYRMDQVQLKLCKNPKYNQLGTYVYNKIVYIFASLKKDANIQEHLNYKDKFIRDNIFQWECQVGLNIQKQSELINSKKAFLFIRKVESENGIVLPFTFVGTGKLTNPRKTDNAKGSLLFDILMDESLPDYLQYDFGLTN